MSGRFDMENQSPISLAPYVKYSMRLMRLFGCVWDVPWAKKFPMIDRNRHRLFAVIFTFNVAFLVASSVHALMTIEEQDLRIRQYIICVSFLSYYLQLLVLYTKWNDFCQLANETPPFADKANIEADLRHAFKILRPWTLLKLLFCLGVFLSYLSVVIFHLKWMFDKASVEDAEIQQYPELETLNILGLTMQCIHSYNMFSMAVFQFGIAMMVMTLLTFINGYLNHLKYSIVRVRIRDPLQVNVHWIDNYDEPGNLYDIRYCIAMHQYIIRIVELTNSVLSWVLQLIIWQTLAAFVAGIKIVQTDQPKSFRTAHFTGIYMADMFCYCYLGNDIQLKSEKLATACLQKLYEAGDVIVGDWKSLQVVAVRCQTQSLQIKGGPFYVLNLRTFIAMFAVTLTLISFS